MSPKYKLIYFNFMGIVEPIRLLFALAEVDYEDYRIPEHEWIIEKSKMPWGTVPVLYVDGKVLCQSLTILRYLGKKFNRAGATDFETAKCNEYVDAMSDVVQECMKQFFEPDEEKKKELGRKLKEEIMPKFLRKICGVLKENGTGVLVGKELTYADLYIGHMLSVNKNLSDDCQPYPEVLKYSELIFSNPKIAAWVKKRPHTAM